MEPIDPDILEPADAPHVEDDRGSVHTEHDPSVPRPPQTIPVDVRLMPKTLANLHRVHRTIE